MVDTLESVDTGVGPGGARSRTRRPGRRRRGPLTYLFRAIAVTYLFFLVVWPLYLVGKNTFANGLTSLRVAFENEEVVHALRLTLTVSLIAVAINLVFGVTIALLLVRQRFPGRRLLSALVDLPLSVSPIVVGLAIVLVYNGRDGWFGPALEDNGFQVVYAVPAIVMATAFVSLSLMIRELVPVLEEIGTDQEQAARSLGAGPVQVFRRITLPSIKWAVIYGFVLTLARSIGEFGAVKIVAGNIIGQTQTATLVVEEKYQDFQKGTAYAVSFLLALVSVACLVVVSLIRPKEPK